MIEQLEKFTLDVNLTNKVKEIVKNSKPENFKQTIDVLQNVILDLSNNIMLVSNTLYDITVVVEDNLVTEEGDLKKPGLFRWSNNAAYVKSIGKIRNILASFIEEIKDGDKSNLETLLKQDK